MKRNQVKYTQDLYDVRAKTYDASFHKRFSSHLVQLANPQPGESLLGLACGTGLVTFSTSKLVGKPGYVTGIDVSTGMLAEARAKLEAHPLGNFRLVQHSITDLGSLHELEGRLFDRIACASALVLLPQPEAALRQWMKCLKPCSRLIIGATHPRALLPGMVLERVGACWPEAGPTCPVLPRCPQAARRPRRDVAGRVHDRYNGNAHVTAELA